MPALGYVRQDGCVLRGDCAAPAARVKMWAKEKTIRTESGIVCCVSANCPCAVAGLRNQRARGSSSCCGLFRTCFQPSGVATTNRSLLSESTFLSSLKSRHSFLQELSRISVNSIAGYAILDTAFSHSPFATMINMATIWLRYRKVGNNTRSVLIPTLTRRSW